MRPGSRRCQKCRSATSRLRELPPRLPPGGRLGSLDHTPFSAVRRTYIVIVDTTGRALVAGTRVTGARRLPARSGPTSSEGRRTAPSINGRFNGQKSGSFAFSCFPLLTARLAFHPSAGGRKTEVEGVVLSVRGPHLHHLDKATVE